MRDMESFTEWLADQCGFAQSVELGYVSTVPHKLLGRCDDAPVPELMALATYPNKDAASMAMDELVRRYLKTKHKRLADIEAELMAGV